MEVTTNTGPSFLTPSHTQSLDMLLHVQEFSATSVLITGSQGTGKSSLLQAAFDQLSIHHQALLLSATDIADEQQLIIALSSHLGCLPSLSEIEASLAAMVQQQETFHLCIDDAHLLQHEALEILLAKSLSANGWRLILAGDQHLKQVLDEMQVSLQQESLYHLVALEALSEEDSDQLVKHLYQVAGFETLPLSAKQLHQLYVLSAGNAAKLVDLVDADKQQKQKKSTQFPLTHVAAVVLVGSALLVSSLYQEDSVVQDDAIAQLLNQPVTSQQEQGQAEREQQGAVESEAVVKSKGAVKSEDSATAQFEPEQALTAQAKSVKPALLTEQSTPVTQSKSTDKKSEQEQQALARAKQTLLDQAKQKSLAQQQAAKRIKANAQQAVAKSNRHPLLNAQGKQYVLQLLGVRSKASAQEFVDRFSRQLEAGDLSIYQTQFKGAPWYVVVYGPFDTKQLASQQAGSLSKTMKSAPWVRPLSKIQEDIRKYKQ